MEASMLSLPMAFGVYELLRGLKLSTATAVMPPLDHCRGSASADAGWSDTRFVGQDWPARMDPVELVHTARHF